LYCRSLRAGNGALLGRQVVLKNCLLARALTEPGLKYRANPHAAASSATATSEALAAVSAWKRHVLSSPMKSKSAPKIEGGGDGGECLNRHRRRCFAAMARHPLPGHFIAGSPRRSISEGGWRATPDDDEHYVYAILL
jgi:hypothetical protein